jgi:hypothetical protein
MSTQVNVPQVDFLVKGDADPGKMPGFKPFTIFHPVMIGFLSDLSKALRNDRESVQYPDVATFAFFCRSANLAALEKLYVPFKKKCVGRGVTFHIAPSNVPVNFAYSLAVGLLSGNACIVRLSEKQFPQVDIICKAIQEVLDRKVHAGIRNYLVIVRYAHSDEMNAFFSRLCDTRIIWGGDSTIARIRRAPLPARAFDVTFADRYSMGVIDAEAYLGVDDKYRVAVGFFNDTYLFDQNACTSPRLLIWIGSQETVEKAKAVFWKTVEQVLADKGYKNEPITVVDKFSAVCGAALCLADIKVENSRQNTVMRVKLNRLDSALPDHALGGGVFYEYTDTGLDALMKIISRKYQTLTYIGFDPKALRDAVIENGVTGIDRIVPFGRASDFSLIWDGYDLIRQLSRMVDA